MPGPTPTAPSSSSPLAPLIGKSHLAHTCRLDGAHVVFGELIEGEDVLKQLELAGSRSGTPTGKLVIEDCGDFKKEESK